MNTYVYVHVYRHTVYVAIPKITDYEITTIGSLEWQENIIHIHNKHTYVHTYACVPAVKRLV